MPWPAGPAYSRPGDQLVILCGAGISLDPPSRLPSGAKLLRSVIGMLLDSDDIVLDGDCIRQLRRVVRDLRLELALELLARHINPRTLVQVYAVLRRAVPNYNHLALATADVQIITTNQDTLIEAAAERLGTTPDVLHLHGRCDRPATVVTLISQYMAGLPRTSVCRFQEKLRARNVLVLWYSGRDRDIMGVLEESSVAHVEWVLHPGSGESPELRRLQNQLGSRIAVRSGLSRAKLAELLTRRQQSAVLHALPRRAPTARPVVPHDVRRQFASIGRLARNLSLAAVLRHASLYEEAERVYTALGGTSPSSPAALLLAIASARAYQQHFDEAIAVFARVLAARGVPAHERGHALLGQVEVFRNTSQGVAAARKLEELAPIAAKVPATRERARLLGRAATQSAGIARVDGNLSASTARYSTAIDLFRRSRDLNEQLESACWRADVLRMRGHYQRAHAAISAVLQESMLYVRYRVRAWAYLVGAEIDCARGEMRESARWLELAAEHFLASQNPQALVWTDLLRAAQRRIQGRFGEAEVALDGAGRQLDASAIPRHFAQARFSLESAELARSEGDFELVVRHLRQLRDLLLRSKHFSSTPSYLHLHAALVEAECERDLGRGVAENLSRIGRRYEELGFEGCAARARVAAWLSRGERRRPRQLLRSARTHGRQHELAWLEGRAHGLYPIAFA